MPPKPSKGKGKAKETVATTESKLVKMRKETAIFPLVLDEEMLMKKFKSFWAKETSAHPATQVRAASSEIKPGEYPFFAEYF